MGSRDLAKFAAETLLNKKATDVNMIDISEKSSFADYFVNATAANARQLETLADEVLWKFEEKDILPKNIEGKNGSGWILMDYGDVIVNIFTTSMRDMYSIEKVWGDCNIIKCED